MSSVITLSICLSLFTSVYAFVFLLIKWISLPGSTKFEWSHINSHEFCNDQQDGCVCEGGQGQDEGDGQGYEDWNGIPAKYKAELRVSGVGKWVRLQKGNG